MGSGGVVGQDVPPRALLGVSTLSLNPPMGAERFPRLVLPPVGVAGGDVFICGKGVDGADRGPHQFPDALAVSADLTLWAAATRDAAAVL